MNKEQIIIESIITTSASQLYSDWLNSEGHSKITGGKAEISDIIGSSYTAWNGYINGKNISLEKDHQIIQSWRTTEFNDGDEDSLLELSFESIGDNKVKLTLKHSNIPAGDGEKYKLGWQEHYIEPMHLYYNLQ